MGVKNLRIISDNLADTASYFPSNEDPLYPITNIITEDKLSTYRSSSSSVQLLLTWDNVQTISSVILGFTSLKNGGTYRVRLYTDSIGSIMVYDTGVQPFKEVNASIHKHISRPIYFTKTSGVIRMVIDLDDTVSGIDHIEIGRLIIGDYWSPRINFDTTYSIEFRTTSTNSRNTSGTLISKKGVTYKVLDISLPYLVDNDRNKWFNIQYNNSTHKSLFMSLFPENDDSDNEQTYQIYGRLVTLSNITYLQKDIFATSIVVEEI